MDFSRLQISPTPTSCVSLSSSSLASFSSPDYHWFSSLQNLSITSVCGWDSHRLCHRIPECSLISLSPLLPPQHSVFSPWASSVCFSCSYSAWGQKPPRIDFLDDIACGHFKPHFTRWNLVFKESFDLPSTPIKRTS